MDLRINFQLKLKCSILKQYTVVSIAMCSTFLLTGLPGLLSISSVILPLSFQTCGDAFSMEFELFL